MVSGGGCVKWFGDVFCDVAGGVADSFDLADVDYSGVAGGFKPHAGEVGLGEVAALGNDVEVGVPRGGRWVELDFEEPRTAGDVAFPVGPATEFAEGVC